MKKEQEFVPQIRYIDVLDTPMGILVGNHALNENYVPFITSNSVFTGEFKLANVAFDNYLDFLRTHDEVQFNEMMEKLDSRSQNQAIGVGISANQMVNHAFLLHRILQMGELWTTDNAETDLNENLNDGSTYRKNRNLLLATLVTFGLIKFGHQELKTTMSRRKFIFGSLAFVGTALLDKQAIFRMIKNYTLETDFGIFKTNPLIDKTLEQLLKTGALVEKEVAGTNMIDVSVLHRNAFMAQNTLAMMSRYKRIKQTDSTMDKKFFWFSAITHDPAIQLLQNPEVCMQSTQQYCRQFLEGLVSVKENTNLTDDDFEDVFYSIYWSLKPPLDLGKNRLISNFSNLLSADNQPSEFIPHTFDIFVSEILAMLKDSDLTADRKQTLLFILHKVVNYADFHYKSKSIAENIEQILPRMYEENLGHVDIFQLLPNDAKLTLIVTKDITTGRERSKYLLSMNGKHFVFYHFSQNDNILIQATDERWVVSCFDHNFLRNLKKREQANDNI